MKRWIVCYKVGFVDMKIHELIVYGKDEFEAMNMAYSLLGVYEEKWRVDIVGVYLAEEHLKEIG